MAEMISVQCDAFLFSLAFLVALRLSRGFVFWMVRLNLVVYHGWCQRLTLASFDLPLTIKRATLFHDR